MIVSRKLRTFYDVDLLGAGGLALLGLTTWWLVLAPWQQMWHDYCRLVAARATAEARLHGDILELERFEQGLAELGDVVASEICRVPRADSLSQLLHKMTDVAADAQLELLSVTPQPATTDGAHLVASDIHVASRGRSHDFIRFLDQFAQANPYQSVYSWSITRPVGGQQPICELSWSVRLYLLPAAALDRSGGQP